MKAAGAQHSVRLSAREIRAIIRVGQKLAAIRGYRKESADYYRAIGKLADAVRPVEE